MLLTTGTERITNGMDTHVVVTRTPTLKACCPRIVKMWTKTSTASVLLPVWTTVSPLAVSSPHPLLPPPPRPHLPPRQLLRPHPSLPFRQLRNQPLRPP